MGGDGATGTKQEHTRHRSMHICDPCWQNECECTQTNFERHANKSKKMLILVKFEVFTKIRTLSPRLAFPILQIVIKQLQLFLFVRFLRGVAFLPHKGTSVSARSR